MSLVVRGSVSKCRCDVRCPGEVRAIAAERRARLHAPPCWSARSCRCSRRQQFVLDAIADRVAHVAIDLELLLFRTLSLARVREAPVQALPGAEEDRAGLIGLVAHRDHRVERLVEVAIERLALLARDVDAELRHGADRQRPHVRGLGARGERLEAIAAEST